MNNRSDAQTALEFLKGVEIFSLLEQSELEAVIEILSEVEFSQEAKVFSQGDKGNQMFIVKSGQVSITIKLPDGSDKKITEFKSGDFFGEMSIFDKAPRSAGCVTEAHTRLYNLPAAAFFRFIKDSPEAAIKIMYKMLNCTTRRLRDTNEFVSDMVHWGEEARRRVITDPLTGVYNRRFLEESLEEYYNKALKDNKPFVLIMMDIDHFREVNEIHGQQMGDEVLLIAVKVFKQCLRKKDIIARYGGDEFTILLPDTEKNRGLELAELIRRRVESLKIHPVEGGPVVRITTSQGLVSFPQTAVDLKKLQEVADSALYSAKENGRNRVVCV